MENRLIDIIRTNSNSLLPLATEETPYTKKTDKIKSIIFDIYGTLLISASGDIGTLEGFSKSEIFLKSLKKSGINICSNQAGVKGVEFFYNEIQKSHFSSIKNNIDNPEVIISDIWKETLTKLINENLIIVKLTKDIILQTATYFECYNNPVWPMPDLLKVLNILKRKEIVLGIISNAQFYTPLLFKALTNFSLHDLGFNPALIQFSYLSKESKPSLKMFNSMKSKLGSDFNINPSNTLYIGNDMLNDIYSANRVGFKTALFAGDARSLRLREREPRVTGLKPDFLITKLIQITEFIK